MRSNEATGKQSLTNDLERLLVDLTTLETCTISVLKLVKSVLGPLDVQQVSDSTDARKARPVTRGKPDTRNISKGRPEARKSASQYTPRHAQQVIKTCLSTLKLNSPSLSGGANGCTLNDRDHSSRKTPKSMRSVEVVALCCDEALKAWARISSMEHKERLAIVKTRFNLLNRLLELELLEMLPANVEALHSLVCCQKSPNETRASQPSQDLSSYLRIPQNEFTKAEPGIVLSTQLLVLRYLHLAGSNLGKSFVDILDSEDGPFHWFRHLCVQHDDASMKILTSMNRQLLKLTMSLPKTLRLRFSATVVDSILSEKDDDDKSMALVYFCRALDGPCTYADYDKVQVVARRVVGYFRRTGLFQTSDQLVLLIDRMSGLAHDLGKEDHGEAWLLEALSLGTVAGNQADMGIYSSLKRYALELSGSATAAECLPAMLGAIKSIRDVARAERVIVHDTALFDSCLGKLRSSILKCAKVHPELRKRSQRLVGAVIELLFRIVIDSASQISISHATTSSGMIQLWLKLATVGEDSDSTLELLEQARTGLELSQKLRLEDEIHAICITLYNWAGGLYNQVQYKDAADLLEIYFHWRPPMRTTAKQLEYIWSSYIKCENYSMACSWLLRAAELLAEDLHGLQDNLIEHIVIQHADLVRVLGKSVQLSKEHPALNFQLPLNIDDDIRGLLLELQMNKLSLLAVDKRCIEMFDLLSTEALSLYAKPEQADSRLRVLSFTAAYFHRCGDHLRMGKVLKLCAYTCEGFDHLDKHTLPAQLYCVRLNLHQLLLPTSVETEDFSFTPIDQLVRAVSKRGDQCLDLLCIQVLQEMQEIFTDLNMPMTAIIATELLLTTHEASTRSLLGNVELMNLHVNAAELYISCGYNGRASIHLAQAAKLSTSAGVSVSDRYRLAIVVCQHSALLRSSDMRRRVETVAKLMSSMPRKHAMKERVQFLICLSRFAENVGRLGQAIAIQQEALNAARHYLLQDSACRKSNICDLDSIASGLENLTIEGSKNPAETVSIQLLDILQDLARLYQKAGLVKDAMFYADEACQVAKKVGDQSYQNKTHLSSVLLRARMGYKDIERKLQVSSSQNPYEFAEAVLGNAELLFENDFETSLDMLQACEKRLEMAVVHDFVHPASKPKPFRKFQAHKSAASNQLQVHDIANVRLEQITVRVQCILLAFYEAQDSNQGIEQCFALLQQANEKTLIGDDHVLAIAKSRLRRAMKWLTNDPVYGALHDSALSLPSVCPVVPAKSVKASKTRGGRQVAPNQPRNSPTAMLEPVLLDLSTTRQSLMECFSTCLRFGDSLAGHVCSHLHNTLDLLQASLEAPSPSATATSTQSSYLMEIAKALPIYHERQRKMSEISSAVKIDWQGRIDQICSEQVPVRSDYQRQFIDVLPTDWVVVAANLSTSGTELVLSRIQANKTTLIIRLPMSRHASRDVDEDTFAFEDAKNELRDIISQSDASAQEAKSIKDKEGKSRWWSLRQELDERLSTLLDNIEHCWLGGFVGIFGASRTSSSDPDGFRVAFGRIILKHVPLKPSRLFDVDTRILDLFLDLGPLDGHNSLEILEDLLYFVLDIYQFHGESIAYDEIDIDQMVVDVQVALSNYHGRTVMPALGHTVLILDKNLHVFPWESLPCLRNRSVSRAPSLTFLRDLLHSRPSNVQIARTPGRYVLNPSKDLKSTEKTFLTILQSIPDWSGMANRQPEEAEMISYIESSSIFIYFGHGGGEQYVRGSKIRKLKSCGVVILMGCSSGALKDQGIFDPWGTPYNYVVADCPSLVVNLWDVTDKDIDRFSMSMLSKWSLIPSESPPVSICDAVAQSRDECVLKYLNGAAPVVYGLPLSLEPHGSQ